MKGMRGRRLLALTVVLLMSSCTAVAAAREAGDDAVAVAPVQDAPMQPGAAVRRGVASIAIGATASVPVEAARVDHPRATIGDTELVQYRWSGMSAGSSEPIESDWLAVFDFDGDVLRGQRHYVGR